MKRWGIGTGGALKLAGSFNKAQYLAGRGDDDLGLISGRSVSCSMVLFGSAKERDSCQTYLRARSIYCPVHWICHTGSVQAIDLSSRILSLPIRQRYTENQMDRIAALHAYEEAERTVTGRE